MEMETTNLRDWYACLPADVGPSSWMSRKQQTSEPTLNKNSQDCSMILYTPLKKQATRHIWNSRFSCKNISVRSGLKLHK